MRCWLRLKNVVLVFCIAVVLFTVPAFAVVRLDNAPPVDAPYMGGYWLSGDSPALGEVTIYLSDNEGWTVDTDGYLYRFADTSASGVMYANGNEYTFNAPAFAYPRYRLANTTGYTYTDLEVTPVGGNIIIQNDFETPYDIDTMCSVLSCFLLGMLVVVRLVKRG